MALIRLTLKSTDTGSEQRMENLPLEQTRLRYPKLNPNDGYCSSLFRSTTITPSIATKNNYILSTDHLLFLTASYASLAVLGIAFRSGRRQHFWKIC